jgi:phosphatidylserine/phosphatidylglycerophosphate/cardiolipin synthase-like enzyme
MPTDPFKQVKAYFSPGRDALEVTIGFIQNTKKTLDVAIFSLTHAKIVGALLSAHARGVKGGDGGAIRILTDKDQMGGMAQREAAQSLSVAGLDVRVDTESGYFHNKYAISDYGKRGAAVICGSYNWTARATERNRESLVRIRVRAVVGQFHQNFEEVWAANGTVRAFGPTTLRPE